MKPYLKFLTIPAGAAATIGFATVAWAYWTAGGSGHATATVGTLSVPTLSAPGTSGSTVPLSWTTVTPPGSGSVTYYVSRDGGPASVACGSSSSPIAATSCDDTGLSSGSYSYTVTAVYRSWTATSTPPILVVVNADEDAPTAEITFPADGGLYSNASYHAGCAVSGICGTVADATGVAAVEVSILKQGAGYWNGLGFVSPLETFQPVTNLGLPGGTATSWNYSLVDPGDGLFTVHVRATDTVGNAQTGTAYAAGSTFTIDAATPLTTISFPVDGSSYNAAGWTDGITGSATDVKGVTDVSLTIRQGAGNYYDGSGFNSASPVSLTATGSNSWSYPLADSELTNGQSYTVAATATDNAGNASVANAVFTYDTAGPTVSVVFPANNSSYNAAGWTDSITGSASDVSPVSSVSLTIRQGTGNYYDGSGFNSASPVSLAATGSTSWSYPLADSKLSNGQSYTVAATATDSLNQQGLEVVSMFTFDTTAPAAFDIQAVPSTPGNSTPGAGDKLIYTFNEVMDPTSILAGWATGAGNAQTVTVHIENGTPNGMVVNAGGTENILGTVDLGAVYLAKNTGNGNEVDFPNSTMTIDTIGGRSVVTVTLGGPPTNGLLAPTGNKTLKWSASSTAKDLAGTAASTAQVTESGFADPDF